MTYKVIVMPSAERRFNNYVYYTLEMLKNKQAAKAILRDLKQTQRILADTADMYKICENPILSKYEYRTIRFQKHRFLMVYRIEGDKVIVDGMFHELQDYAGLLIQQMNLE